MNLLPALTALLAAASPATAPTPAAPPPEKIVQPAADDAKPPVFQHIDVKAVDAKVDPCADFYAYACRPWLTANPIPADRASFGVDTHLQKVNEYILKATLERAAEPRADRSQAEQEIGDAFAACMDDRGIEAKGLAALQPLLGKIDALKSTAELPRLLAQLHRATFNLLPPTDSGGATAAFFCASQQDYDDASKVVAALDQGGLGLPDRDYYLKADPKSVETRTAYLAHVQKMLELSGVAPAEAAAQAREVVALETALAKGALELVARRDPANLNHKLTVAQLQKLSPKFEWKAYLDELGMPASPHLVVAVPEAVKALEGQLEQASLPTWKAYLRWHLLHASAPLLPKAFVDENFAFFQSRMRGVKEQPPRWRRCANVVDRDLGEALGQAYAARAFPPASKARTSEMVNAIEKAMASDIDGLEWMTAATKKEAHTKLGGILDKIGYPAKPRDYSSIKLDRATPLANAWAASGFELHRQLQKIGKPVDRQEWGMTAPTVNAYYDPQMNTINFPAGILQPVFFDPAAGDAVNFGAIGAVIGHELTHGFDDEGRKFDARGNLRDWWTAADVKGFESRAKCVVDEFSGFTVLDGLHVNGELTIGENIADLGGIRLAHEAWRELQKAKKANATADDERAFFVAYAQSWCTNMRDEALRLIVQTNPHAPPELRVNGVVTNVPDFAKAFGCKAGAPMARANACRVW